MAAETLDRPVARRADRNRRHRKPGPRIKYRRGDAAQTALEFLASRRDPGITHFLQGTLQLRSGHDREGREWPQSCVENRHDSAFIAVSQHCLTERSRISREGGPYGSTALDR
jgi:hypothetical protein